VTSGKPIIGKVLEQLQRQRVHGTNAFADELVLYKTFGTATASTCT
jgi:hypothetical protein